MTREEAITILSYYDMGFYDINGFPIPAHKLAEACDMAIDALSASPWIPVNESIPEDGKYLVTMHRDAREEFGGTEDTVRVMRVLGGEFKLPKHYPAWVREYINDYVTAWQPLPEPYREVKP